ncbi:hypothetical protein ES703_53476 [subsurface metagenome]
MFDIIVLVMSIVVNIIFMIMIVKFRDIIRFGLMLRKVLRDRGYFKKTAEELNESVERCENFAKPFLHPEDEVVPKPDHMKVLRGICKSCAVGIHTQCENRDPEGRCCCEQPL